MSGQISRLKKQQNTSFSKENSESLSFHPRNHTWTTTRPRHTIFKSLFTPFLLSLPGFIDVSVGVGGEGRPSVVRRCLDLSSRPPRSGTCGWLCMIHRSEARSWYYGAEAEALLGSVTARVVLAFPLA